MNKTESSTSAPPTDSYLSLKSAKASKSGARSQGYVHYRILTDAHRSQIFLTLVANDGSGCFSREIVPFARIESAVQGIAAGKPIASKQFQPCFVSKSQNNAGFLAAVLRNEKLLQAVPDAVHQHALAGDWPAWKTAMLTLADGAETYRPEPPKPRGNSVNKMANAADGPAAEQAPAPEDSGSATGNEERGEATSTGSSVASTETESPELSEVEMELLQCKDTNGITNQSDGETDPDAGIVAVVDHRHGKKPRRDKLAHPSSDGNSP